MERSGPRDKPKDMRSKIVDEVHPPNMTITATLHAALGLASLLLLAFLCSENRRRIPWRTVISGVALQLVFALLLIGVPGADRAMFWLNDAANALHAATLTGTQFVFGYLGGGPAAFAETHPGASFILAFQALPLVLTISALASLLFYWGILQRITAAFAWLLRRSMGISGPLALGAAVHVFVGMVEAPLLVRPYLSRMQRGELFALMTCGMAGVAGTVMIIYASFLGPFVPNALGHILIASIISTPAGLAVAALMVPFDTSDRPQAQTGHRGPAAQQPGRHRQGHHGRRADPGGDYRDAAGDRRAGHPGQHGAGIAAELGRRGGHTAAIVRRAVPPGHVADRRALGRNRRRLDADGDQDGAERVRRLPEFLPVAGRDVFAAQPHDPDLRAVRLCQFRQSWES